MDANEKSEWLKTAQRDLESGGLACSEDHARELARQREAVGGHFPVEYPDGSGGCYVFQSAEQMEYLGNL